MGGSLESLDQARRKDRKLPMQIIGGSGLFDTSGQLRKTGHEEAKRRQSGHSIDSADETHSDKVYLRSAAARSAVDHGLSHSAFTRSLLVPIAARLHAAAAHPRCRR